MTALMFARSVLLAALLGWVLIMAGMFVTHSVALFWPAIISGVLMTLAAVACVGIQTFIFVRRKLAKSG